MLHSPFLTCFRSALLAGYLQRFVKALGIRNLDMAKVACLHRYSSAVDRLEDAANRRTVGSLDSQSVKV